MITIDQYVRPASLAEAYELNQKRRNKIIGGMLWLKMGTGSVGTAIDLTGLGLDAIEEGEDFFSIGAMVSLRQLEQHTGLNAYCRGTVRDAVKDIVGVQFRNMATVGGSLWGRFGFSDVLTVFLAMDCQVELYKAGLVPLKDFVNMKKDRDILVRVVVRKTPGGFAYRAMRNQRTDFPVLTCCTAKLGGAYRAVIGARPHKARLVEDAQGLLKGGVSDASAKAFAAYAAEQVVTGSNMRGSAEYRTHLVRVLTARALLDMGGDL